MPTSRTYFEQMQHQLEDMSEVGFRFMMGEYVLYFRNRGVGGLYDDRLLLKATKKSKLLMPDAPLVKPYEGGKDMLWIENTQDGNKLRTLFEAIHTDLQQTQSKKR